MSQEFSALPFAKALQHLSILKCILKWLQMVFEIFALHSCQIWTLYNTFTVPETHKFEQNKTRTTDSHYEHVNTKKQELTWQS